MNFVGGRKFWTMVAICGGAGWLLWKRRRSNATVGLAEPPQWPPFEPVNQPEQWVKPSADGSCPLTHPIKANNSSMIYHPPDGRSYDCTNADRCYGTAEDADADGYRAAKR